MFVTRSRDEIAEYTRTDGATQLLNIPVRSSWGLQPVLAHAPQENANSPRRTHRVGSAGVFVTRVCRCFRRGRRCHRADPATGLGLPPTKNPPTETVSGETRRAAAFPPPDAAALTVSAPGGAREGSVSSLTL